MIAKMTAGECRKDRRMRTRAVCTTEGRKKKKVIKRKSIQQTLMAAFVFSIMLPILMVDIYSFFVIRKDIYENYYSDMENVIRSIDENFQIYFDQLENQLELVSISKDIRACLDSAGGEETLDELLLYQKASEYINQSFGGRSDISAIRLYNVEKEMVLNRNTTSVPSIADSDKEYIESLDVDAYGCQFFGARKVTVNGKPNQYYCTMGSKIIDVNKNRTVGFIIVDLNYNMIRKFSSWENIDGDFLLIYDDQIIYDSKNKENIFLKFEEEKWKMKDTDSFYYKYNSERSQWRYLVIADKQKMFDDIYRMMLSIIAISGVCFVLFFLIARGITEKIVISLQGLERSMQEAEDNGFDKIAYVEDTYQEISRLISRFNVMQVEIQNLTQKQEELSRKKAYSEYKALKFQITPHFLYNSLDSINCLAQIKGETDISKMILSLGDIFKYTTRSKTGPVTLLDEIKHVKNYCRLQAIRYQEKFEVVYEVEEEYYSLPVIQFMLQPLVENAIRYGMSAVTQGGLIKVGAEPRRDFTEIYVWNNGAPFDQEAYRKYEKIFETQEPDLIEEEENHIGLINIYQRLKFILGKDAGMKIDITDGTKVCIRIPGKDEGNV